MASISSDVYVCRCENSCQNSFNSKGFKVTVGMHQGSALSPLLFVVVMEAIPREFRVALSWELLHADDLAVIAETEEELIKRLNEWKDNVESKGTHTHPFNGPLSGTTRVSQYQKGKTNLDFTEARDSEWQWHQLGHVRLNLTPDR